MYSKQGVILIRTDTFIGMSRYRLVTAPHYGKLLGTYHEKSDIEYGNVIINSFKKSVNS